MPKVRLKRDAVLNDGGLREYKAGDIVERSAEWCRKWVEAGYAEPVDQATSEAAASTRATAGRSRKPEPEAR